MGSVALASLRSAEAEGVFTQSSCLDKTARLTDPRLPRAKERGGPVVQGDCPFGAMQVGAPSARRVQESAGGGAPVEADRERADPQKPMPAHS